LISNSQFIHGVYWCGPKQTKLNVYDSALK